MKSSGIGWLAFIVLAALIGITSCQAGFGTNSSFVAEGEPTTEGESEGGMRLDQ